MSAGVIADRLERGWQMIDQERDPRRRAELEEHWLQLLRQYETACDATRGEVAA